MNSNKLLNWYDANRRVLPWREDPSPYHVWLSEIMLQQTRVEAVKGYYARFLETCPDIESLAKAPEDVYLKLWEGLGYYSRVRNLHKAAVQIMEDYQGKMPDTEESLRKLAGIGPYTAAAIASIAFGRKAPAIDGNLLRVYARMTEYKENIKEDAAKKNARDYYLANMEEMTDHRPGDFNQALMDLGATVCLPNGAPLCDKCPMKEECGALAAGTVMQYPVVPEKKKRSVEKLTIFLLRMPAPETEEEEFCYAVRKRPETGLLASLYEFPNAPGHLEMEDAARYVESLGLTAGLMHRLPGAKHIFTHKEWHMTGYLVDVTPSPTDADFAISIQEKNGTEKKVSGAANTKLTEGEVHPALIFATPQEIRQSYSIPSAFAAYNAILTR